MMRALDRLLEPLDRAVYWFVSHLPGPVVLIFTIACYPGLGLMLPLALGLSWPWVVLLNVFGVTVAMVFGLGWLLPQIEAARRRHLLEWTSDLRTISGEEFEWLVGEVFHREGWHVQFTGKQDEGDGNIDLELTRGRERKIVQCKAWQSWHVGVKDIRGFGGTLLRESLPRGAGIFVTLSEFSPDARREAADMGIELVDRVGLLARMEKVRRAELCEICHQPMRLARSEYGYWFRCVTPACSGKLDLGPEARAIEFLTEVR